MIGPEQLEPFMAAVHGRTPFPWQQTLADRVLGGGGWPEALDVPTGLGKTSALDIAVLAAARAAQRGEQPARRVFFVVDRRLVVDEAYEHARALADALDGAARDPLLAEVGDALRGLAPRYHSRAAFDLTRMRGGTTWDWRWVERPDRFGIVTGTVDQLGSRLLFRGYGVTDRRRSIDAAMVGTDSLVLVDEAHLAEPLLSTLTVARDLDRPDDPVRPGPVVVRLSATPRSTGTSSQSVFDLAANLQDPTAARRLQAPKTLHTVQTSTRQLPAVLAAAARVAGEAVPTGTVAVVANTVGTAREVFRALSKDLPSDQLVLLTGRNRPLARDRLLHWALPGLKLGWRAGAPAPTRYLVATQTIEVGANLDLDVLLSESAAWDALVQRLGRLNRVGDAPASTAVVVHPTDAKTTPPVYGEATTRTWQWLSSLVPPRTWSTGRAVRSDWPGLSEQAGLDVGPAALRELLSTLDPRVAHGMTLQPPYVPVLFRQHLDCWTRTGPVPEPDVPVHLFLHGVDSSPEPVRLAWRADVTSEQAEHVDHDHPDRAPVEVQDGLAAVPVRVEETLEVPLAAARALLSGEQPRPVADQDVDLGVSAADPEPVPLIQRPVFLVRPTGTGTEVTRLTSGQLRPGQLLVLPSTYGGCDEFGWDPASSAPVLDVADLATGRPGSTPILRLSATTLGPLAQTLDPDSTVRERLGDLQQARRDDPDLPARLPARRDDRTASGPGTAVEQGLQGLRDALDDLGDPTDPDPWAERWRSIWKELGGRRARLVVTGSAGALRLTGRTGSWQLGDDESRDGSSLTGVRVSLHQHGDEVAALADEICRGLALPDRLRRSVVLAARWHDLGKIEPRFQVLLHGGDVAAAASTDQPIAKSGMPAGDRAARRAAAVASGYPSGGRHEELSAVLVRVRLEQDRGSGLDNDLVLHLVAAHHGHARPLLPPVNDAERPAAVEDEQVGLVPLPSSTVDWSQPDRFAALNERYGRWGLALLESVVRLSDIACSAGETLEGGQG